MDSEMIEADQTVNNRGESTFEPPTQPMAGRAAQQADRAWHAPTKLKADRAYLPRRETKLDSILREVKQEPGAEEQSVALPNDALPQHQPHGRKQRAPRGPQHTDSETDRLLNQVDKTIAYYTATTDRARPLSQELLQDYLAKLPGRGWDHDFSQDEKDFVRRMIIDIQRIARGDRKAARDNIKRESTRPRMSQGDSYAPDHSEKSAGAKMQEKRLSKKQARKIARQKAQADELIGADGKALPQPDKGLRNMVDRAYVKDYGDLGRKSLGGRTQQRAQERVQVKFPSEAFDFNNYQPLQAMTETEKTKQLQMVKATADLENMLSMQEGSKSERAGHFKKYRDVEMGDVGHDSEEDSEMEDVAGGSDEDDA